jgi:dihydroorotate dehydrogenase electron transfer subunit
MNTPKISTIIETIDESKDTKTINFKYNKKAKPGQFFMVWIPTIDEIPMSVSNINNDIKSITFRKVGDATKALYNLKKGDRIGIRGPFGNGFRIRGKNILFIGGGTGIATLTPAIEQAKNQNISSSIILGVKNKEELFFEDRFRKINSTIYISTDDGSRGYKGLASDLAMNVIKKEKFTDIITCGPEIMMKLLLDLSGKIRYQASLERYIKCSLGICGQCCIGDGLRVCKDGPVFDGEILKTIKDFGIYKRDPSGKKIFFKK